MKHRLGLTISLLLLAILITAIPLALIKGTEFGGADGKAEGIITEMNPNYKPWAANLMEPPGGETESLLFCIQVGLGALVLGYGFGYLVARKKYA